MNPVDEYFMAKEAAGFGQQVGNFLKTDMGRTIAGAGVTTLGTAALMGAPTVANKIYQAATKRQNFNAMMNANPDLEDFRSEEPKQLNSFYNSLHRLNPTFARDPIVAGSYIRQMTQNPSTAGKVLVESLKGAPAASMPGMGDAWRAGAGAGGRLMGEGIQRGFDPLAAQQQQLRDLEVRRDLSRANREMSPRGQQLAHLKQDLDYEEALQDYQSLAQKAMAQQGP